MKQKEGCAPSFGQTRTNKWQNVVYLHALAGGPDVANGRRGTGVNKLYASSFITSTIMVFFFWRSVCSLFFDKCRRSLQIF